MNTIKSVYYGWGTLIVAGGGAYYFAKRSINDDRARKAEAEHQKRLAQYELEAAYRTSSSPPIPSDPPARKAKERENKDWHVGKDEASSPSHEASTDPAPTRHAPEDEAQKMKEKSKYEASDVYRSRKGDRLR
ncbi:hypothetical protein EJ04DRAFT_569753 [Polyplosphaeria fusca]|uniref:Uncharacterized protein n=1 Tax=Polyplosphaeria fusca TaxID=682080 RepID=A0A9P4UXH0_9PLEO|nr:hypothetical protein EJ04DRAFT_569753 [Polyplosphaeria fusca]